MKNSYDNLIEKFFTQKLSDSEQIQFDKLFLENSSFRKQVEYELSVKEAIKRNERAELKVFLQSLNKPEKRNRSYKGLAVAASLTGLILLLTFSVQFFTKDTPDKLFSEYFHSYPNIIAPAVRSNSDVSDKIEAFAYYDSENFEQAVTSFDELYSKNGESYALLYGGLSCLELGQTEEAIKRLEPLSDSSEAASWYLALAYLKKKDKEKAIEVLSRIQDENSDFFVQSKSLLNRLK